MRRFAFRLALTLGRLDVDKMLGELTAPQFLEWLAFWHLEPFGPLQQAQFAGDAVAATINANPFRKRRGTLRAKDVYTFLAEDGGTRPTAEQLKEKVQYLIAAFGVKVEKGE